MEVGSSAGLHLIIATSVTTFITPRGKRSSLAKELPFGVIFASRQKQIEGPTVTDGSKFRNHLSEPGGS